MASSEQLNVKSNGQQEVSKAVALRNFFARLHEEGETWDDYACALRTLSEPCDFGDMKEALIRNRFVSGITHKSLRHLQYLKQAGFCNSLPEQNVSENFSQLAQKAGNVPDTAEQIKTQKKLGPIDLRFKKTCGAADGAGVEFEWQMITLVYLRLLNSGSEFYIGSNMAAAGLFDDIVVKYRADSDQPWSTAMLQLKHKKNAALTESALLALKDDFSLVKYCDSYCKMKSSKDDDLNFLGEFRNHQFILFTNSSLKVNNNVVVGEVESAVFGTGGKAVSFGKEAGILFQLNEWIDLKLLLDELKVQVVDKNDADVRSKIREGLIGLPEKKNKAVNSAIQLLAKNPTIKTLEEVLKSLQLVRDRESNLGFLENLQLYTRQAGGMRLEKKIKQEISNTFNTTDTSITESLFNELNEKVKSWWKSQNTFLTQDSRIWLDIIREQIAKLSENKKNDIGKYNLHFLDSSLKTFFEQIPVESRGICHILVESRTTASTVKVMAALARLEEQENILYVDMATLLHHEDKIIGFWSSRWCRILVVECDTEFDNKDIGRLCNKIINVVEGKLENKLMVLIAREGNGLTDILDNLNGYKCHRDSSKWSDLTEDSRENLLGVEIELQGVKVTLKRLVSARLKLFSENVNGDVISQLLQSEIRCGKNLESVGDIFVPRRLRTHGGKVLSVNFLGDVNERVVLVVAEPGMGKSTLITHLANSVTAEDPTAWVVHVRVNDCTHHLATMDLENFTRNAAKKIIEKISLNSANNLEVALFRSLEENLVVCVDGIDEVCPQYEKQVFEFLKHSMRLKMKQLWVSSRPSMQYKLESLMQMKAFDLEPFSLADQVEFFVKAWKLKLREISYPNLEIYAHQMIAVMGAKLGDSSPIWEVPLMASMVADVFEEDLRMFVLGDKQEIKIILDMMSLYDTFMHKKYDLYSTEKKKLDQETSKLAANIDDEELLKQMFYRNHRLAALRFFFSVDEISELQFQGKTEFEENLNTLLDEVRNGREKRGVIDNVTANGTPHFVHRTFAEYFVASWLSVNFMNNKKFVEEIFERSKFTWIRDMFNHFMAKDLPLHTAVLNSDLEKVERLLNKEPTTVATMCNAVDRGGRTPLHLAVMNGDTKHSVVILQLLLQHKARVDVADNLLSWRPLQYAHRVQAWTAAGMILAAGGSEDDMSAIMSIKQPARRAFVEFIKKSPTAAPDVSLMLAAARDAGLFVVRYLVEERRGDVKCRGTFGETLHHMAAEGGDVELLEYLYTTETPLNDEDLNNATPLHYAGRQGNMAAVRFLVERGLDLDAVDEHGETCLQIAAQRGDYDVMELLVDSGAEYEVCPGVELNEKQWNVSLLCAAFAGSLESVRLLVELGTAINTQNAKGERAIDIAWSRGHVPIVEFILSLNSNDGETMFHTCCRLGYDRYIPYILSKGNDINSMDANGCSGLLVASARGHLEVVRLLVENGASMVGDEDGDLPLHLAALEGKVEVVSFLIQHVDINVVNNFGRTALSIGSSHGHLDIVRLLVSSGASMVGDKNGDLPLHYAAWEGKVDVVSFFLQLVDINVVDKKGRSALALGSSRGHLDVVKLLVENNASMVGDEDGDTPLHYAAWKGNVEVVSFLIQHVDDVNVVNKKGRTALAMASANRHPDVAGLLVANGAKATLAKRRRFLSATF